MKIFTWGLKLPLYGGQCVEGLCYPPPGGLCRSEIVFTSPDQLNQNNHFKNHQKILHFVVKIPWLYPIYYLVYLLITKELHVITFSKIFLSSIFVEMFDLNISYMTEAKSVEFILHLIHIWSRRRFFFKY